MEITEHDLYDESGSDYFSCEEEEVDENEPWFHELLHADGTPYSEREASTFQHITEQH